MEFIALKYNYIITIIIMMIGLWAMISKNNLIKKLIGMSIFQTSIILFYISISAKKKATIPILSYAHGKSATELIQSAQYTNPLPHVLMLTAIVVGVATLGLALAIVIKISQEYSSIEEDEILESLDK